MLKISFADKIFFIIYHHKMVVVEEKIRVFLPYPSLRDSGIAWVNDIILMLFRRILINTLIYIAEPNRAIIIYFVVEY